MAANNKKEEKKGGIVGSVILLVIGIFFALTQADSTWLLFHVFEVSGLVLGIIFAVVGALGVVFGILEKKKEKENTEA